MANYVLVHGGNMTTDTWNALTRYDPVHTPDGRMGGRVWTPLLLPSRHITTTSWRRHSGMNGAVTLPLISGRSVP